MSRLEMTILENLADKFVAGKEMSIEELEMLATLMKKRYIG